MLFRSTAERLIVDMRDRLTLASDVGPSVTVVPDDPVSEAVSALVALGFKPAEASKRVAAIEADGRTCEDIVRLALQAGL